MNQIESSVAVSKCALCQKSVSQAEVFCKNCGYPQHGSINQKEEYKKNRSNKRKELESSRNRIYRVTGILGFVSLMIGIVFLGILFKAPLPSSLLATGLGFVIYGGLTYWSLKKPFPAVLIGLILFSTAFGYEIITSLATGQSLSLGNILFRSLIIYFFIRGVIAAKKITQLEQELAK